MIKILLADDHNLVREGLKRIVEESPGMEVIAEASDGRQALQLIKETNPDVALIDISMPELDGLEVIRELQISHPSLPIIVLTMHEEEQYIIRAIEAGAMGYITKRSVSEQLVKAIHQVYSGSRYLTSEAAEALALRVAKGIQQSPLDNLSTREMQVLRHLALGLTNREIAEKYFISTKTVDTYRLRILKKLILRNNADLSRFAMQHKLI